MYSKRKPTELEGSRFHFVPVIASFNSAGECRPLYFRFVYPDGTYTDIAIDKVISFHSAPMFPSYVCLITIGDTRTQVTLRFHSRENRWSVDFS